MTGRSAFPAVNSRLEHFPAKHDPAKTGLDTVCVEKMRSNKELEPHSDSIGMKKLWTAAFDVRGRKL
jgi:hypothetical protein